MASMWRRAMLYLGLGPDDEYDDYDMVDDSGVGPVRSMAPQQHPQQAPASRYPAAPQQVRAPEVDDLGPSRAVRTIGAQPVRPQGVPGGGDPAERPRTAVVRPP